MKQCRICSKIKNKIKSDLMPRHGYYYRDEHGSMWLGNICPDCVRVRSVEFGRTQGHGTVDQVSDHCNKKGRQSEQIAKKWFEDRGYTVTITKTGKGPDLNVVRRGDSLSVEVKSVITRKRKTKNTFKVKAVSPNRVNDDLIAYVWDDGKVTVKRMKEHLKKCWADGDCGNIH